MSETLYETDMVEWALSSANLLREGFDIGQEHRNQIADELEWMARSDRRELSNRSVVLISHLLKVRFQPQKRTRSWEVTIRAQRMQIKTLLKQSPSLKHSYQDDLPELYALAKDFAEAETNLTDLPEQNPFTLDEILNG